MDITIVIPVYNRKELLKRTLDTIPDSYPVIIVDNGSTDGSFEWCERYVKNSGRELMTVTKEEKRGAAAARNKGLSLCKTKWVYFFDSDDEFTGLPTSWDEDADMVFIPVNMNVDGKSAIRPYKTSSSPYVHILNSMLSTQSMIFNAEWLRRVGGWNEQCLLWDDWELGLRTLLNMPRIEWLTEKPYHNIIVHQDSITGSNFSSRYKEILTTLRIAFDEIYEKKDNQKDMLALFIRSYILSGHLLKEGNEEASKDVEEFIYDKFNVNEMSHKLGRLFRWYASKGGRGGWKIALTICKHL